MNGEKMTQTILIIDDEVTNINILNEVLKPDYKVVFAKDGEKGMKIARSETPPDLILLDIMMPGLDGYEVCEILKKDKRVKNIPVIFITIKASEEHETRGFELGAVDYITKPFNPVVVRARVKAHLELKKHRDFLEWMLKERTKELQQMEKEYAYLFFRK
ncbi:MAG TPA: response regulator [Smithellaceae bacterium]|nr:response regulator [Smithellaceae bacterium]